MCTTWNPTEWFMWQICKRPPKEWITSDNFCITSDTFCVALYTQTVYPMEHTNCCAVPLWLGTQHLQGNGIYLRMFVRRPSLILDQLCGCPRASDLSLLNIGKPSLYFTTTKCDNTWIMSIVPLFWYTIHSQKFVLFACILSCRFKTIFSNVAFC